MITQLIDKQDNFEVVLDQIAAILALETASQQALAIADGQDPDSWKLRVYQSRHNMWENLPDTDGDGSPVVNVWWDNTGFDPKASNSVERQRSSTIYNIDITAFGRSQDTAEGHLPGDLAAAQNAQRAVKLVRNILMAGTYTYLKLRGVVGSRAIDSISNLQPQQDDQNVNQIVAVRIAFRVDFNEFSPQVEPTTLDLLTIDVLRAEDGQIVAQAEYDYTV